MIQLIQFKCSYCEYSYICIHSFIYLCQDPPKCGGNITTEGAIETPNAPHTTLEDGGCVFWIQAPEGKVVNATFSQFSYAPRTGRHYPPHGRMPCSKERVEIRTEDLYEGRM